MRKSPEAKRVKITHTYEVCGDRDTPIDTGKLPHLSFTCQTAETPQEAAKNSAMERVSEGSLTDSPTIMRVREAILGWRGEWVHVNVSWRFTAKIVEDEDNG